MGSTAFLSPLVVTYKATGQNTSICGRRPVVHARRSRALVVRTSWNTPRASATGVDTGSALRGLQNGSDVRGVALDIGGSPVTLSVAQAREISAAFVRHARERLSLSADAPLRVAIGRDSRLSGPELAAAAAAGAGSEGASVTDFGLATTPAMFMATVLEGHEYDATMMLTASHLPPDRNGIKFFTKFGGTDKNDVRSILDSAVAAVDARGGRYLEDSPVNVENFDFIPVYSAYLVKLIREGCSHPENYDTPLSGFKVVVDAGNGAAGFFADQVLAPLGAEVYGQFLDPDGMFPNHIPNPEDPKAMQMTIDSTLKNAADLGVIFDTDVDRSGVVNSEGLGINRNKLIALLARIVLREYPGSTIVTDSVTSNGLRKFIEQYGGKHFRYRKGYKNVIDKGVELDKAGIPTELAIETSGHGAMKENYMLDDGAYLAVKIIIEMVRLRLDGNERGIGALLDDLEMPLEENEFRLGFFDKTDFQSYGKLCVEAFAEFVKTADGWTLEEVNHEGYRVRVDEGGGKSGWLLLRQSLHDPILPLNIESEVEGGIAKIAGVLLSDFLPDWDNVNPDVLSKYS